MIRTVDGPHAAHPDEGVNPVFVRQGAADEVIRVLQREQGPVFQAIPLCEGIALPALGAVFEAVFFRPCLIASRPISSLGGRPDEVLDRPPRHQQGANLSTQGLITGTRLLQESRPPSGLYPQSSVIELLYLPPALRCHLPLAPLSSRSSQTLANPQSRLTVSGDLFNTLAASLNISQWDRAAH